MSWDWGSKHLPKLRLGCLPYLNVKPLVYPFEHGQLPEGWDLVYAAPAVLAEMLLDSRIDLAPVSSFACLANGRLSVVPDICISSDGSVKSVLMLSKVPFDRIRTVAADTSSLSGRALLRIVLSELYGLSPEFVPEPPDIGHMLAHHDAALIIGNPAMLYDKSGLYVLDLGDAWKRLTGLPAVFAVWAGIYSDEMAFSADVLRDAKYEGLGKIEEIVQDESRRLGLSVEECRDYLTNVIRYDLGDREIESLRIFGRKAFEHGLIEREAEIRFFGG